MTPEDEREAQYADELLAELLDKDESSRTLEVWAAYLVDGEQVDSPIRHRDFVIVYIACYRAHDLGPKLLHIKTIEPPEPKPIEALNVRFAPATPAPRQ